MMKCRQCVTPETTVFVKKNGKIDFETIENLYNDGYRGKVQYYWDGKYRECEVVDIWESGQKDILEIQNKVLWGIKIGKLHS